MCSFHTVQSPGRASTDWGVPQAQGPRLPTCDVDAVVQRGQGEAPLVEVGEVRERHPPLCRERPGIRLQSSLPGPAPRPLLLMGCRDVPRQRKGKGDSAAAAVGAALVGGVGGPGCSVCTAGLAPGGPRSPAPRLDSGWPQGEPRGRPGSRGRSHTTLQLTPLTPKWTFWSGLTSVRRGDRLRGLVSSH